MRNQKFIWYLQENLEKEGYKFTRKDLAKITEIIFETIKDLTINKGIKVTIFEFGSFRVRKVNRKIGIIVGQVRKIKPFKTITFSPSIKCRKYD